MMLSDKCKTGQGSDLQITDVSVFDEGEYYCYYTIRKSVMKERITMKIKGQPIFLNKDGSNVIHEKEGENLTLQCMLQSGSTEQLLIETEGYLEVSGGPEHLNFTMRPSRTDRLKRYLCIANSSEFDNPLDDYAILYICHIPDTPVNITIKTCFYDVSISWQPGNSGNLHQVFYIQYKEEGAQLWNIIGPINQTVNADIMTYQISNIPYNKFYQIRVFAENDVGQSKYSEVVTRAPLFEYDITATRRTKIGLKYCLVWGVISGVLILICLLSHVWRHHRAHISVDTTNDLQTEAHYDEIGAIYYQQPAPLIFSRNNIMFASTIETETRHIELEILHNNEPETYQQESISIESFSRHNATETVNSRDSYSGSTDDSSTGTESSDKSSDYQTVRSIGHENLYTSIITDIYEDHSYSLLDVGNPEIRIHDGNDYINMRI